MSTRRFTYDANGKKIYIGSIVIYKNRHFLEKIQIVMGFFILEEGIIINIFSIAI